MPSSPCANSKDCIPQHQTMTMVSPSLLRDLFWGPLKFSSPTCVSLSDLSKQEGPHTDARPQNQPGSRREAAPYRRSFMANRTALLQTNKGTIRFELLEPDSPK